MNTPELIAQINAGTTPETALADGIRQAGGIESVLVSLLMQALGSAGGSFLTSSQGAVIGKYRVIEIREDSTTFTALDNALYGGATITGLTFSKGERIYGLTTKVHVATGSVHAIK